MIQVKVASDTRYALLGQLPKQPHLTIGILLANNSHGQQTFS